MKGSFTKPGPIGDREFTLTRRDLEAIMTYAYKRGVMRALGRKPPATNVFSAEVTDIMQSRLHTDCIRTFLEALEVLRP